LTLKAVRCLMSAEVVLVDDLVDRAILRFVSLSARIIEVGKRGGCRSTPQPFIERLMIRLARRGEIVARVKGGDPFVFGRGGEELLALTRAGVACEVVPGVTAGIGVPAALGIPLTLRGVSHGVSFVSAHLRDGKQPDWKALAATQTTLVIYMGMKYLTEIVAALRAAGMAESTPAAVIQDGTTKRQRYVRATLATLSDRAHEAGLGSPALVIIGNVVNHAHALSAATAQAKLTLGSKMS
jgi:uroporphyrin-III C-methyltransferase